MAEHELDKIVDGYGVWQHPGYYAVYSDGRGRSLYETQSRAKVWNCCDDLRAAHRRGVAEERERVADRLRMRIQVAENANEFLVAAALRRTVDELHPEPDPADDAQPQVSTEPKR